MYNRTWTRNRTTESQAHKQGYYAYQGGDALDDNPYNDSDEWRLNQAWQEGYNEARWEDQQCSYNQSRGKYQ